jgi:hypothetical protein
MRNSLPPGLRISRAELAVSSPTLAFHLKNRGGSPADVGRIPVWREGPVQDRADGGHSFSYSLPRLRIAGPLTYTDERGKPTAVDVSGSGWADSQWGDFLADQDW